MLVNGPGFDGPPHLISNRIDGRQTPLVRYKHIVRPFLRTEYQSVHRMFNYFLTRTHFLNVCEFKTPIRSTIVSNEATSTTKHKIYEN